MGGEQEWEEGLADGNEGGPDATSSSWLWSSSLVDLSRGKKENDQGRRGRARRRTVAKVFSPSATA